jgi:tetratricopeptide (TPR) repeat protein
LPGARHIQLDVLTEDEGARLLSAIVGDKRAKAEPEAIADVVRRCGQLPLAIRMAGARLAARPTWPVSVLADQLADERGRLDELEVRDAGVRASFLASIRGLEHSTDPLDNAAAAAFPLLGILDCPDLSVGVAARLFDRPLAGAEKVLERLVDSHLLETPTPGRYRSHDLVRTYAREFAVDRAQPDERDEAVVRVLRYYNTVTWRAFADSSPTHVRLKYLDEQWIDGDIGDTGIDSALTWLIEERNNIAATLQQAAEMPGVPRALISQLSIGSLYELNTGGFWPVLAAIARSSLAAASVSGDRTAQAFAHHDIAAASARLRRHSEAVEHMTASVELFRSENDQVGEAMALCNLAYSLERAGHLKDGVRAAQRALDLCLDRGLRHLEATTCLVLGMLYDGLGDRPREIEHYRRSLSTYAEIGHDRGRARAHYNLAVAHRRAGRRDEAVENFHRAMELCDQLDLVDTASETRTELAEVYGETGQMARALALSQEAADLAAAIGSEFAEARARQAMGGVFAGLKRPAEARREWAAALAIYEQLGAPAADDVRAKLAQGAIDNRGPQDDHRL